MININIIFFSILFPYKSGKFTHHLLVLINRKFNLYFRSCHLFYLYTLQEKIPQKCDNERGL